MLFLLSTNNYNYRQRSLEQLPLLLVVVTVVVLSVIAVLPAVSAFSKTPLVTKNMGRKARRKFQVTNDNVYDIIIIGGGSAGLTAAKLASKTLGASTCLIEAEKLGGDCTHTGCVPSKSLLALATAMSAASIQPSTIIGQQINQIIQGNIELIYTRDDSPETLQQLYGVTVLSGKAVLEKTKNNQIKILLLPKNENNQNNDSTVVNMVELQARKGIILCTGARPRIPTNLEIPGLETIQQYFTYDNIWSNLERILSPSDGSIKKRLTIIGGGPVGCELAQAFTKLGLEVTMIIKNQLLLSEQFYDESVRILLQEVFTMDGITIYKNTQVRQVESFPNDTSQHIITCLTDDGTSEFVIRGDLLLVATGRIARTSDMGLEQVGIKINSQTGGIQVNEQLQTSISNIYAAGDCTGDRQFTHYAGFQGAIAARNILLPLSDKGVLTNVPSVIYTKPEIATVGLSALAAQQKYGSNEITIAKRPLDEVDRAVCDGNTKGFIEITYKSKSGKIVGATIVAPSAGEIISEISTAMKADMAFWDLATVMHPYPTYAMTIQLMAADAYYEKTMRSKWLYDILTKVGL